MLGYTGLVLLMPMAVLFTSARACSCAVLMVFLRLVTTVPVRWHTSEGGERSVSPAAIGRTVAIWADSASVPSRYTSRYSAAEQICPAGLNSVSDVTCGTKTVIADRCHVNVAGLQCPAGLAAASLAQVFTS